MTVEERVQQNLKDANVKKATSFSKGMPPAFDGDSMLQKGDKFVIPATMPEVYSRKFGEYTAEFITVELIKANGERTSFDFYPSSLSKTIFPAEMVDGKVTLKLPVMHPKGDVVDHYLSFRGKGTEEKTDVQLAMESMLGWTIEIADDLVVTTQKWADGKALNELKNTHVFTYKKA